MLFDPKDRNSPGPIRNSEASWDYLERSGRIEAQNVRDFLEHWVADYPLIHRDSLVRRLRSNKGDNHQAATFELIVYALLRSLNCSIEVEPDLPNGSAKRPDFLAVTSAGESVYVEATLAFEDSPAERAAQRQIDRLFDGLEKLHSPAFSVTVRVLAQSAQSPNEAKLRNHLEAWLAGLDPDQTLQAFLESKNFGGLPRTEWRDKGWVLAFEALARPVERRGLGQRFLGPRFGNVAVTNSWAPIRGAIERKGTRYGLLPHPYLIAVNVDSFSLDLIDELQALYGQEEFAVNLASRSATMQRKADGVWLRSFRRVSGVWLFPSIGAWTAGIKGSTVHFNPWANLPLPALFKRVTHVAAVGDELQPCDGLTPGGILGLPQGWPS